MDARISSADLVHRIGGGFSLHASMSSMIARSTAETLR